MHYMIQFYEDAGNFAKREDPTQAPQYWGGWIAYSEAVAQAQIVVSGAGLMPPQTATTLRVRNDRRDIQDGPHADSKEQLGGFFVIDVPDLDAALAWAERSPAAHYGTVEIRPVLPPPPATTE